eukprot:UN08274
MLQFEKEKQVYFRYWIFYDGDIHVSYGSFNSYWQTLLLHYNPSVAFVHPTWSPPNYPPEPEKPIKIINTFDGMMNAFHRWSLPFYTTV